MLATLEGAQEPVFTDSFGESKGDRYRVTTDLTIRGLTRPVVLNTKFLGISPGMRGGRRVGFTLSGTIARKVWGLNWNVALEAGGRLSGRMSRSRSRSTSPADDVVESATA